MAITVGTSGTSCALDPLDVERAVVAARLRRVADHDPQPARLGDVLERRAEQVVVAGQLEHRHLKRREQLVRPRVLGGIAGVRDVAGDEHRGRRRAQLEHARDGRGQRGLRRVVVEADVWVADLGQEDHDARH